MSPEKFEAVTSVIQLCGRIGSVADLPEMLKATADTLAGLLEADRVSVIEFDIETRSVGHIVGGGPGASSVVTNIAYAELWEGLSGWVLRERRPALSPKDGSDGRESPSVQRRRLETNAGSIIVVPVTVQDRFLGTMTAINTPQQRDFTEDDVRTMEMFGSICAVAIENTRLVLQLRESQRALLDENDIKDRLFTVLAHDLRGPIGNLRSMLELLFDRVDEPELVRELVGLGKASVDRTYRLTENLLTWIRSQIRGIPMLTQRVRVAELLAVVRENLQVEAAEKQVSVTIEAPPLLALDTEPTTVQSIVRNLVSNAIKFSPPGAEVVVSAERDGPEVIFEVRDSGTGMTPEQLAALFRGRPVSPWMGTDGEKGNGLGLMFSADLAKTVHGWLEASSTLGQGSSVKLIVSDADPEEL